MHSCKIYACVSGCLCMNECGSQKTTPAVIQIGLWDRHFQHLKLTNQSRPSVLQSLGTCLPWPPQHWDCKRAPPCLTVLHGCWGLNFGLHVCKTPQLSRNSFQKDTSTWVWLHIPVIPGTNEVGMGASQVQGWPRQHSKPQFQKNEDPVNKDGRVK